MVTFWERVERRDPPPPDETRSTRAALLRLYPQDSGKTIVWPQEQRDVVERYRAAHDAVAAAKAKAAQADAEVQAIMGAATFGALPNGRFMSWKTQHRKAHEVSESTTRVLKEVSHRR